jgi:uncharacterized protein YndB with AHSA1/START domain
VKTTEFVYKAYIAAPAQRVWEALVRPSSRASTGDTRTFRIGGRARAGSIAAAYTDEIEFVGRVIECDPPHRLVMTWADPGSHEPYDAQSRVSIEVESVEEMALITVRHDRLTAGSHLQHDARDGWPRVLSSLKSLLETGRPLPTLAAKATR